MILVALVTIIHFPTSFIIKILKAFFLDIDDLKDKRNAQRNSQVMLHVSLNEKYLNTWMNECEGGGKKNKTFWNVDSLLWKKNKAQKVVSSSFKDGLKFGKGF